MGFLKRISGWLLKQNSVPYDRLIKGHTVANPTDFADKDYVDEAYELSNDNLTDSIAAIMARMGLVIVPTNISLSPFPNPITVNGRNYTLVNRQRVLLIGQTTTSENGVYVVNNTSLVKVNEVSDLVALDGINVSANQIGAKRWNDNTNALRFNSNGEMQVRIKNTGQVGGEDVFSGFQVEPTTGEIYALFSSFPGANGAVTIEDFLANVIGIAAKLQFSKAFSLSWDGVNSRALVELNPNNAVFQQEGGYTETFENSIKATDFNASSIDKGKSVQGSSFNTFTHGQEYSEGVLGYCQISVPPNNATSSEASFRSLLTARVNANFSFYFKARVKVNTLTNTHTQMVFGLAEANNFGNLPANGVFFHLKKGTNSDRIRCVCVKDSTSTIVNLGAGYENEGFGYRDFEIHITTNSNAKFYIDGTLVATISTNLPDTATNMNFRVAIGKTTTNSGSTSEVLRCGLFSYYYEKV